MIKKKILHLITIILLCNAGDIVCAASGEVHHEVPSSGISLTYEDTCCPMDSPAIFSHLLSIEKSRLEQDDSSTPVSFASLLRKNIPKKYRKSPLSGRIFRDRQSFFFTETIRLII